MTQAEFLYCNDCFEDFYDIIPNSNEDRFFNVEEVEVYKIYN